MTKELHLLQKIVPFLFYSHVTFALGFHVGNSDHSHPHTSNNVEFTSNTCQFPCRNFTKAFIADANAVWFRITDITKKDTKLGTDTALLLKIKRFCRLEVHGNIKSEHIAITADELKVLSPLPIAGRDYVAAVLPSTFSVETKAYRLLSPLVQATSRYPWKQLCRSCGMGERHTLGIDDRDDEEQAMRCSCEIGVNEPRNRPCKHFIAPKGEAKKNSRNVAGTIVGAVVGIILLGLLGGLAYWQRRKREQRLKWRTSEPLRQNPTTTQSGSYPIHQATDGQSSQYPTNVSQPKDQAIYFESGHSALALDGERRSSMAPLIVHDEQMKTIDDLSHY